MPSTPSSDPAHPGSTVRDRPVPADLLARLGSRRLLVVTGKGGVGKTAVTATLGRALAGSPGGPRRVLVLEVDPRENLHQMLGLPPSGGEVADAGGGLWLQNLKPREVLDRVVRERIKIDSVARRVLRSPVYRQFAEGAPGLEQVAVLGHAVRLVRGLEPGSGPGGAAEPFDLVLLDAPATGHGVSLLAAPRLLSEVIRQGPFGEMGAELARFVADAERCAVVAVTTPEEMPVQEALELAERLEARIGRRPELLVVNGCYAPLREGGSGAAPGGRARGEVRARAAGVGAVETGATQTGAGAAGANEPLGQGGAERPLGVGGLGTGDMEEPGLALWRRRRRLQEREMERLGSRWPGPRVHLPKLPADRGPVLVEQLVSCLRSELTGAASRLDAGAGTPLGKPAKTPLPIPLSSRSTTGEGAAEDAAPETASEPSSPPVARHHGSPRSAEPPLVGAGAPPLLVVVGSGGVGKTTLAAALGLVSARRGHDTLVMTFDPSLRLKDALGVGEGATERPVEVALPRAAAAEAAGARPAGRLEASLLDARRTFDRLVARYAPDEAARDRILGNRFYAHLSGHLAGILEYMAVERLWEVAREGRYGQVVLDTPPTRQALDFLEAPARIVGFLESGAVKLALRPWFDEGGRLRAASRFGFLGRGFERFLDEVVGLDLLRDMAEFFRAFEPLFEGFRERARHVEELLRSPKTRFLLVSGPGEERIADTLFFARRLEEAGYRLGPLVVNRLHPDLGPVPAAAGEPACAPDGRRLLAWLGERDRRGLDHLRGLLSPGRPLAALPLLPDEPTGLDDLERLGRDLLRRLEKAAAGAAGSPAEEPAGEL